MKSVALILAKSQSKRLKNKNTLDFNGQPMFMVNVKKCLEIFDDVYVSSDSDDVLRQAIEVGALVIKRPEELCGDTPNIPVYQHAIKQIDGDIIVAVQANSPTIDPTIIREAKRIMENGCQELMTINKNGEIYGSVWALTRDKIETYGDPYNPEPEIMILDTSVDIHTLDDLHNALKSI